MTIRLLIADDHDLVREGLKATFEYTEIEVIAEAAACDEAIQLVLERVPDVLLLDISMPDGDGFEVLECVRIKTPSVSVVMYSMHDREHYLQRARQLGATGYLTKQASSEQILNAVRAASRAESSWTTACTA